MTEERNRITRFAMEYGLYLSAYFILKFGVTVMTMQAPFLAFISWVLLIGVPFVLFWMLRNFRDTCNDRHIDFSRAWSLSMLLIFFASLPEALTQYIYFQMINPSYIQDQITQLTQSLESISNDKSNALINDLITNYKNTDVPSAIQMAFQGIFNNLFFGGIVSLIVAAIVKRNRTTNDLNN